MNKEEIGQILDEMHLIEVEKLSSKARKLFDAVMKIADERDLAINYLKDLVENKDTNNKVLWFDIEYAKIYGELCSCPGTSDNRLALVPLSEIEKFLSKIEKR